MNFITTISFLWALVFLNINGSCGCGSLLLDVLISAHVTFDKFSNYVSNFVITLWFCMAHEKQLDRFLELRLLIVFSLVNGIRNVLMRHTVTLKEKSKLTILNWLFCSESIQSVYTSRQTIFPPVTHSCLSVRYTHFGNLIFYQIVGRISISPCTRFFSKAVFWSQRIGEKFDNDIYFPPPDLRPDCFGVTWLDTKCRASLRVTMMRVQRKTVFVTIASMKNAHVRAGCTVACGHISLKLVFHFPCASWKK